MRRARAYGLIMSTESFFIGRTAAVILGAPLEHTGDLDVGVFAPARAPRRRGIRAMKLARGLAAVLSHDGLRVTSPATTWAMLAGELSIRQLVHIGDAFVRVPRDGRGHHQPAMALTTIELLRRAALAPRRRERAKLLAALALVRVGSASPLESDFRIDAARAGLPEPELDVEIFADHGRRIGISEVVFPRFRTVVEIEGDHHRTSRAQWHRDIEKYAAYGAEGWEVVRLTSEHIRGQHPLAVGMVWAVLLRHGWQPE